jgi:hypothetical protein
MISTLELNNLNNIGGFEVSKTGEPKIVETPKGKAIAFNGTDGGLILRGNPLRNASSFTIEVIFKPEASYPNNIEQRFIHIQNLKNENSRILIELRLTNDNKWFLDTFMKSDDSALTLYADNYLHPVGEWYHAALVYDGKTMKHFVNGVEEMSGLVDFNPIEEGDTSIGMRINKVSWFKGTIKIIKVTPKSLIPEEFISL